VLNCWFGQETFAVDTHILRVGNRTGLAKGKTPEQVRTLVSHLHESNPMLGHRGCRLGITYPEIYEMQARAIFEAALLVKQRSGEAPIPEVMIPLVATHRELDILKKLVDETAKKVFAETGVTLDYMVGTMIELPRAALAAGAIAEAAAGGADEVVSATLVNAP